GSAFNHHGHGAVPGEGRVIIVDVTEESHHVLTGGSHLVATPVGSAIPDPVVCLGTATTRECVLEEMWCAEGIIRAAGQRRNTSFLQPTGDLEALVHTDIIVNFHIVLGQELPVKEDSVAGVNSHRNDVPGITNGRLFNKAFGN